MRVELQNEGTLPVSESVSLLQESDSIRADEVRDKASIDP